MKRALGTSAPRAGSTPRVNLQEQLAWAEAAPKNALQQCLNSHIIGEYLDSRMTRKQAENAAAEKENCLETIQRGRDALERFQALRANNKSSTKLQVVPTPRIALGTLPTGNSTGATYRDIRPTRAYRESGIDNRDDGVSTSSGNNQEEEMVDLTQSPPVSRPKTAAQRQEYEEADSVDDLLGDLDVDALVANHQRTQKQNNVPQPPRRSPGLEEFVSLSTQSTESVSVSQETAMTDELRKKIKQTRENLRLVREECDDASLEGEVPGFMQKRRAELEQELEELSRRFRESRSTTKATPVSRSVSPERGVVRAAPLPPTYTFGENTSSNSPTCSCGMLTAEAKVQYGQNAGRMYYRCSICGFHSWVDGETGSGGDRYSNPNKTHRLVVEQPCVSTDPGVNTKMQRAKRVLRDVFGHNAFRPNQERTVMEAFSKRDVFVLMPTGGGKSLCYQLPACIDDGVTIVISPLVSLIQDQVQQLEALDVGVANLKGGDQDYETTQRPIVSELFSNSTRIKMLYVTPEKIASSGMLGNLFESLEKRGRLARFVIDEAHCISQWGHDFRKDYLNIGQLRLKFPSVPIMALTATANTQTETDIVNNLKLSNPFITRSSFNRPNLTYDVRKKSGKFMSEIADFVGKHMDDSGIIYCLSKKDCEQTAEKLIKALGLEGTRKASQISFYHAGLEPEDRAYRHHEWSKGKIKLIVATVAFGMGINKPDVRYVIHHTIPQSVTHYYQEAGRAGRDGELANCILYYSFVDLTRRRKLITKDRDNLQHRNVHLQNLRRMTEFCENQVECRRTSLLEYFGEHFSSEDCHGTCDNCRNKTMGMTFEKTDVTEDCLILLSMVKSLQEQNDPATLVQIAQVFLGLAVKGRGGYFSQLSGYGKGKGRYSRSEVERILYHMILRQYFREVDKTNQKGFMTTFLAPGINANRLQRGERIRIVCKTKYQSRTVASDVSAQESTNTSKTKSSKKNAAKKTKAAGTRKTGKKKKTSTKDVVEELSDDDVVEVAPPPRSKKTQYPLMPEAQTARRIPKEHVERLAQLLKDWRASVCDSFNAMPYHILPTSGIAAIANAVPVTNAELLEIDGLGRTRVKKYGPAILDMVKRHLEKNNLTPTPLPQGRPASTALDSFDSLDPIIDVDAAETPPAPKTSPFFNDNNNKHKASLTAPRGIPIDDGLDDIDWGAVDESVLNQQYSSSRKRSLDMSGAGANASKRSRQSSRGF